MKAQATVTAGITTTRQQVWQPLSCETPGANAKPNLRLTGDKHQVIEGFGGCFNEIGWNALKALGAKERRIIFRELFDPAEGCRFSVCRLPVGASDYAMEWYSHNETDNDLKMEHFSIARDKQMLIPYIKEAQTYRQDLKFLASPWSPPTWMKYPKACNYGTLLWRKEILQAYATYFVKFVEAYAEQGIFINQLHVQNEPLADQKFPSCLWTGEQLRDFIRDYLGPLFKKYGIETEIWLGTLNTDDYNGYPNLVLGDSTAAKFISGVGLQWAGKGMVQRLHAAWPGVRLYQTENECGDGNNTWDYAQYVFDLMQHYVTNGVNGYLYWNMVLPPGGRSTWGWRQNAMVTVDPESKAITFNPEFYIMKHLSGFVDPGATCLGLAGSLCSNAMAFENADGRIVFVVNNPMKETRTLTISDTAGNMVRTELPAQSFTTLVQGPAR